MWPSLRLCLSSTKFQHLAASLSPTPLTCRAPPPLAYAQLTGRSSSNGSAACSACACCAVFRGHCCWASQWWGRCPLRGGDCASIWDNSLNQEECVRVLFSVCNKKNEQKQTRLSGTRTKLLDDGELLREHVRGHENCPRPPSHLVGVKRHGRRVAPLKRPVALRDLPLVLERGLVGLGHLEPVRSRSASEISHLRARARVHFVQEHVHAHVVLNLPRVRGVGDLGGPVVDFVRLRSGGGGQRAVAPVRPEA